MVVWKQAYGLALMEFKASLKYYLAILACYSAVAVVVLLSFDLYLNEEFATFDFLFLLLFFMFPSWMKPKEFQMQKFNGNLWTVPVLIMQQHLPISKNVLVKSRFILHQLFSLPYQLILLIVLYAVSPDFREMMVPVSLLAFAVIWLSASFYIGLIMAASEAGGVFKTKTWYLSIGFWVLAAIGVYAFINYFLEDGLITWTIDLALQWPVISAGVSIISAFIGWIYWQYDMHKSLEKTDYL